MNPNNFRYRVYGSRHNIVMSVVNVLFIFLLWVAIRSRFGPWRG